jgi:hypothetical protein
MAVFTHQDPTSYTNKANVENYWEGVFVSTEYMGNGTNPVSLSSLQSYNLLSRPTQNAVHIFTQMLHKHTQRLLTLL